jgi:hypothetical protein
MGKYNERSSTITNSRNSRFGDESSVESTKVDLALDADAGALTSLPFQRNLRLAHYHCSGGLV